MDDYRDRLRGRKVLVTGASGFIGRALTATLVEAGAEVTVLARTRHAAASFAGQPVRVRRGAMTDRKAIEAAVRGQEVIFNLAYDVRDTAAANLASFETLLSVAETIGRARLVHMSSIVVYDGWPGEAISEASPMARPGGGGYRQAKIAMEARLMAGRRPAAILQPTIVWGPGSSLWTDAFAEALLGGGVVLPDPEGLCQGVFVTDVVQAALRAAALPDLARERFIVNGPAPFAWSDLLNGYRALLGRGEVRFEPAESLRPTPQPEAAEAPPSAAARISALGRRLIGTARFEALVRTLRRRVKKDSGPMRPDAHLFALMTARGACPPDAARSRLGYAPAYDLARGLEATADHLRAL